MKRLVLSAASILAVCAVTSQVWALRIEHVGNAPLNERNYRDWKRVMPVVNDLSRVYHVWVNGNDHFYYRGDTNTLNDALKKFAAIEADVHEVILRPGPAERKTFDGKQVRYDWLLHIHGGISRHLAAKEQGTSVFDKYPTMTVFVGGGNIDLEKITIPKGVVVLELADLRARYIEGLESDDHRARGYAAYFLARVDPYNQQNVAPIAKLLHDKHNWVRSMAAGALGRLGKQAESAVPALRKVSEGENEKERTRKRFREVIETIENAEDHTDALRKQRAVLTKISKFLKPLHNDRQK